MTITTTRLDFERLVDLRMEEAKLLMDQMGDWDGAYYLVGYAVEFAFKVRIIGELMKSNSFPERKECDNFYRHDLKVLRNSAGLDKEMDRDPVLKQHWTTVEAWSEQSRYRIGTTEKDARELYDIIEKEILPWIKARW